MFENLLYGAERLLENPIVLALIVGLVRNIPGYIENWLAERGLKYDAKKLGETWAYYEPSLILLTQWLPPEHAVAVAFVIDIFRSAIKKLA